MSSFHVDARVSVRLEYDLAMRLGEFILSSGTEDKQFLALGHKLVRIDEEEQKPVMKRSWDEQYENQYENPTDDYDPRSEYKPVNDLYKKKLISEKAPPIKIRKVNKFLKNV